MNKINVCLSCDDNYSKYAGVVIASILKNANPDDYIYIYILDGNITDANKNKILSLKNIKPCEISFIKINESLFEMYKQICTHKYITLPAYYRLKISELLPAVKRVIYLDCDMVVNTSLKELFNTDLHDNIIGGVLDVRVKRKKKKYKNTNYINSGMCLFDLEKIRNENIENCFYKYAKENINSIKTGDQDIINFTMKNRIEILSDYWNVQVSGFASRTLFTKYPNIVHYIGERKPWIFGSYTYFKDLYFKYLQLTPWALTGEEKEKWYEQNKYVSFIEFIKKRPLFLIRPKYWYAFFRSYI